MKTLNTPKACNKFYKISLHYFEAFINCQPTGTMIYTGQNLLYSSQRELSSDNTVSVCDTNVDVLAFDGENIWMVIICYHLYPDK